MIDPILTMFITFIFASMLRVATPILLAALGECYVENAGILNLGIEGIMLFSAFTSFLGAVATNSSLIGLGVGLCTGLVLALILAVLYVTLKSDQIVVGIAFSLSAIGFTSLYFRILYGTTLPRLPVKEWIVTVPQLADVPIIGRVFFNQPFMVYVSIALVPIFYYILYRTRFGLKVRTLGENPVVADTAGVNVFLYRYIVMLIGGMLAGVGGAYLSLYQVSLFQDNMIQGRGYVAIAIVMFARWNPLKILAGALLYGGAEAFAGAIQALGYLRTIPAEIVLMLPYLITIVGLVVLARRARFPPAFARPYRREMR
ncbi:MAG: ABC transporter permease [Nitrososphaerales archaeon]